MSNNTNPTSTASYIPTGYQSLVPYLIVNEPRKLMDFLGAVFGAEPEDLVETPDGAIMHASMRIGDCMIELSGGSPEFPPMPSSIHIYVPDTDETYRKALAAGAEVIREPADQFYGERGASVKDSNGNAWHIATKTEDLSKEEVDRRAAEYMAQTGK